MSVLLPKADIGQLHCRLRCHCLLRCSNGARRQSTIVPLVALPYFLRKHLAKSTCFSCCSFSIHTNKGAVFSTNRYCSFQKIAKQPEPIIRPIFTCND